MQAIKKLSNFFNTVRQAIFHFKPNGFDFRKASYEQNEALDKCIASIYESEAFIARKAFLKGCEFAVSFILEANK